MSWIVRLVFLAIAVAGAGALALLANRFTRRGPGFLGFALPCAVLSLSCLGVVLWPMVASGGPFAVLAFRIFAVLAPLAALAFGLAIYPRGPLVALAILPGLTGLLMFLSTQWLYAVLALDGLLALLAAVDLFSLPGPESISVERRTGRIVSLAKSHPVTLTVSNLSRRRLAARVQDDQLADLAATPDHFELKLPPLSRSTFRYQVCATRRGAFELDNVYFSIPSRFRLWRRHVTQPFSTTIHVYPDLKQLGEYALLARSNRLSLMGLRRARKIGQDHDFERLRDYTPDDNYKHIDWRSTARRNKLTVKDYQANQSQRVVFLLDCGRMMTNEADGLSLLDHALNASLLLSYVALSKGDAVGLMCFSSEIHSYVPVAGGMQQMNRLLHATFDRFPRLVESRYDEAFRYLAAHCRKRTLVVLITNLIDEVNANQISQYLQLNVGRHLPLGVLLRDRRVFEALELKDKDEPWRAAAAADILLWRHQVLADLQAAGVMALDVFPEAMTAPLVNRYLEVKARHLL